MVGAGFFHVKLGQYIVSGEIQDSNLERQKRCLRNFVNIAKAL